VFGGDGQVVSFEVGDCSALMGTVRELVRRGHELEAVLPAFTRNASVLLRMQDVGQLSQNGRARLVLIF